MDMPTNIHAGRWLCEIEIQKLKSLQISFGSHVEMTVLCSTGRMPPKQIVRREPGDNSSSSSDSFEHLSRPVREQGLSSDSRMVWGSDPYSQSEPLPSVTPPKGRDDPKETRCV